MDIRKVKKLIEMLESSNLNEIEIKEGEESVKLVKSGSIATQTIVPQIPVEKSVDTSTEIQQKDDVKNDLIADSPKLNLLWLVLFMERLTLEQIPSLKLVIR